LVGLQFWLSNNELLQLDNEVQKKMCTLWKIQSTKGILRKTEIGKFVITTYLQKAYLSPNKNWLLFSEGVGARTVWVTYNLRTKQRIDYPTPNSPTNMVPSACWDRDSQRWFTACDVNGAWVVEWRSVSGGRHGRIDLPKELAGTGLLGTTRSNSLFLVRFHDPSGSVLMALFPLQSKVSAYKVIKPVFPTGCQPVQVVLAPTGMRLAWSWWTKARPSDAEKLSSPNPDKNDDKSHTRALVTISDLSCQEHRIVESFDNTEFSAPDDSLSLQWTPDSKFVSIRVKGTTFKAPAN